MLKIRINWIIGIVSLAMISLLLIQFYQVSQQYDQKSEEFKDKVKTLIERIAIRHEKAIELRKYLHVVNKDFSPEYKDILKKEFQNLLTSEESISIRDTVLLENGKFDRLSSFYTSECPEPPEIYEIYERKLKDLLLEVRAINPEFNDGLNRAAFKTCRF